MCHSVITVGELARVTRPNSGGGCRWMLHMLKNAESDAELKGLDVDTLVIEHIQVNKFPRCHAEFTELVEDELLHELSLPH